MNQPIDITYWNVASVASLVLIAGITSFLLKLKLEKQILIASIRMVTQLLLLGFLLKFIFAMESVFGVLTLLLLMSAAAGKSAIDRVPWKLPGMKLQLFFILSVTAISISSGVTGFVIEASQWWSPRLLLPLTGMVLGNSLTGISLCIDSMSEEFVNKRNRIEADLSMGASRWEAAREPFSNAVRKGMVPILNAMTVVGIVSLPGMMTGQILAGAEPIEAVKYQIMIIFMIAAAVSIGCTLSCGFMYSRLINEKHQIQTHWLTRTGNF